MDSFFSGFSDWFTFLGACLAFVLLVFQIREHVRKRASLRITLENCRFFSVRNSPHFVSYSTQVWVEEVELQNRGSEATTVSSVSLLCSSMPQLNGKAVGIHLRRDGVRLEPHDRKRVRLRLFLSGCYIKKGIREIEATLVFETAHGDIRKKVKFARSPKGLPEKFRDELTANLYRGGSGLISCS